MDDLVQRLHALSRYAHDDRSIGDEAADEIERLTAERDALQAKFDAAEQIAWMFDRAEWHEGDIRGRGWRPDISRSKPHNAAISGPRSGSAA